MPTPAERKALLFVAIVAVLGAGWRTARSVGAAPPADAVADAGLQAQMRAVDSVRRARDRERESRASGRRTRGARGGTEAPGEQGSARRRSARAAEPPPAPLPGAPMVPLPLGGVPVLAPEGRAGGRASRASPLAPPPSSPIDLDVATAREIEALPRIGAVLARRIVADRAERGPFGSLEGLQRVRGVGPAMARVLASHVTFSGNPRPQSVEEGGSTGRSVPRRRGRPRPP